MFVVVLNTSMTPERQEEKTRCLAVSIASPVGTAQPVVGQRAVTLSVPHGVVATYVHNAAAPGLGKIGVLVALESSGDKARLNDLGRKIAKAEAAVSGIADMGLCQVHQSFGGFFHSRPSLYR